LMNVTIIGSGNVGSALAEALVNAGHRVTVTAKDPSHADALAEKVGAISSHANTDAVAGADVVILAVPFAAVEDVAGELTACVDGKIVIDSTNPLTPDYSDLA